MIENLCDYFLPKQEMYLQNVSYDRIVKDIGDVDAVNLLCNDKIDVKINGESGVTVVVTRSVKFEPVSFFSLTVSFGVDLLFNKDRYGEVAWEEINLAQEFVDNGNFVLNNLMGRMSLLIAQLTSSYGAAPFVMAPYIAKRE